MNDLSSEFGTERVTTTTTSTIITTNGKRWTIISCCVPPLDFWINCGILVESMIIIHKTILKLLSDNNKAAAIKQDVYPYFSGEKYLGSTHWVSLNENIHLLLRWIHEVTVSVSICYADWFFGEGGLLLSDETVICDDKFEFVAGNKQWRRII